MQCLILAGGLGTRIRHLNPHLPKALLPVAGKPFAHWQLSWLATQGVDVVYSVGYRADAIQQYVGDGRQWGLKVSYVVEESALGTGGAVRLAVDKGAVKGKFFVLYGDAYLNISLSDIDCAYTQQGLEALMVVYRNVGKWDQSNAIYQENRVVWYSKIADENHNPQYIDYGVSEIADSLVKEKIPPKTVYELADAYSILSEEGRLGGFEATQRFFEVGSPAGLRELEMYLESGRARQLVPRPSEEKPFAES